MKLKIITVATVILLLVVMYVPVYAETTIPDPPYGSYDYWVVANSYGVTTLFTSPNRIHVDYNHMGHLVLHCFNLKEYVLIDGNWSYNGEWMGQKHNGFDTIYASNHDIEYLDGSGFFFTPPKVSALYQAARQAKNRGDFGMILRTILAGLIPVLGCLILAISLRKGWAFLQSQLMH